MRVQLRPLSGQRNWATSAPHPRSWTLVTATAPTAALAPPAITAIMSGARAKAAIAEIAPERTAGTRDQSTASVTDVAPTAISVTIQMGRTTYASTPARALARPTAAPSSAVRAIIAAATAATRTSSTGTVAGHPPRRMRSAARRDADEGEHRDDRRHREPRRPREPDRRPEGECQASGDRQ